MSVSEFWEKAESILNSYDTKGDDSVGCDFYVGEMDELFEEWREERE